MSWVNQPITMGTEEPEYFAQLLSIIPRQADRRLSSPNPGLPAQNVDHPLTQRLQGLLNVIAEISLTDIGNVSATMACLKNGKEGTLETQLYVVFNHSLCQVPYQAPATAATAGSQKVITTTDDLMDNLIAICEAIHNYSFRIFAYRVNKRSSELSAIREHIDQDRTHFTPEQRSTLVDFLLHVSAIIRVVSNAQATEQLSTHTIQMLIKFHAYWTKHNLLSEDGNPFTLLDVADHWLTRVDRVGFQLRRWAQKIMSFVISANRLFMLTQSRRLRILLEGKFSVKVLTSPPTTPYQCDLSPETIQMALDTAFGWDQLFFCGSR